MKVAIIGAGNVGKALGGSIVTFARYLEGMAFMNIALNAQNGWDWTSAWKLER